MQSLKNKIKEIIQITTSDEVKYICESVLDITSTINENITNLTENNLINLLNEKFKNINLAIDEPSRQFIFYIKTLSAIDNLGIKSSLNEIKSTESSNKQLMMYPALKYTVDKIWNIVSNDSVNLSKRPEYVVVNEVLDMIKPFIWDPSIKKMYNKVNENYNKYYDKIVLANALYTMKNSQNFIFENIIEKVETALIKTTTQNLDIVLEDLKKFNYLDFVKVLENKLKEVKSKKNNSIEIISDNTSCNISEIYAPLLESYGSEIFFIDKFYYQKNGDKIKLLKNKEQVTESFEEVCNILSKDNVLLSNNKITYYLKNDKFEILKENDEQYLCHKGYKYSGSDINKKLLEVGAINYYNVYDSYNLQKLYEYSDIITKLDFAKRIENKNNKKYYILLFESNNKFYIHKVNLVENHNEFYSDLNLMQARKVVKDYLGFDIKKAFTEYMSESEKNVMSYENKKSEILKYITDLEEELKKVNESLQNIYFKDEKSLIEAKDLLETEINNKKKIYSDIVNKIRMLTEADNDTEINIGDIVKIKGKDDLYSVLSLDSFTDSVILMGNDGISRTVTLDSIEKGSSNISDDDTELEPIYNDYDNFDKVKEDIDSITANSTIDGDESIDNIQSSQNNPNNNLSAYPSDDYIDTTIGSMEPLDFTINYVKAIVSNDYKDISFITGKSVRVNSEEYTKSGDDDYITIYYEGNKFMVPKKYIIVNKN